MKENVLGVRFLLRAALLLGQVSTIASGQTLKEIAKFELPGPPGKRFDYLTIDEDDHYLISAQLAAGQTYVMDLGTNKVIATIADTPGAEGVEYAPGFKKFYTSNAGDNTIGVVDLWQMKVVKKLPRLRLWSNDNPRPTFRTGDARARNAMGPREMIWAAGLLSRLRARLNRQATSSGTDRWVRGGTSVRLFHIIVDDRRRNSG
ncbi:MAG TPA: hypothetical protein VMU26_20285 [Candidatus Polarisedimenticolia bacterium]|nr:hypothetical protein [Candidatus Polarisedimenticolia bacterium]